MQPPYYAQVLELANTTHRDNEVLVHCTDFSKLKELILDPKGHIEHFLTTKWLGEQWSMRTNITMVIAEQESGLALQGDRAVMPTANHILPSSNLGAKLSAGEWVALFALDTTIVRVIYQKADPSQNYFPDDYSFTPPNLFYSDLMNGKKSGTLHFDLNITDYKEVASKRANFILNYMMNPSGVCSALSGLDTASKVVGPGTPEGSKIIHEGANGSAHETFTDSGKFPRVIIVESLSDPQEKNRINVAGEPLVCTQSGCTWVNDHWELDHMIVKNYVAP